jgi:glycine/D-amino acid oxidase-like deaminating enzyme
MADCLSCCAGSPKAGRMWRACRSSRRPRKRFPEAAIRAAGYGAIWHGQKAWNGVAILGKGVKAAAHDHGNRLDHADEARQNATDEDLAEVAGALRKYIPAAAGEIISREICLYSNTGRGDEAGSHAGEFILDRLPDDPRVIVASPCSGHGFKFASAIGEILADLATDSRTSGPPEFRLSRFAKFR